jgi:hypothetical protein
MKTSVEKSNDNESGRKSFYPRRKESPGHKWKRARERLGLHFRDVELARSRLAKKYHNSEFTVRISRLADVEQNGVMPGVHKLYSLCAVCRIDLAEALAWYGIDVRRLPDDSAYAAVEKTHVLGFRSIKLEDVSVPAILDSGLDPSKTAFLSRSVQRWGRLPLALLGNLDIREYRYGYIGLKDYRMFPILHPGAFVLIDDAARTIVRTAWAHEWERPIYFLEHRDGFLCGWCNLDKKQLVVSAHPASPQCEPLVFEFPREIEVIGTVAGVAMTLTTAGPGRRVRASTEPGHQPPGRKSS